MDVRRAVWIVLLVLSLSGCVPAATSVAVPTTAPTIGPSAIPTVRPTVAPTATPTASPIFASVPTDRTAGFADAPALRSALESTDVETAWKRVTDARAMPLVFGDTAVFLYRGPGNYVGWTGDFSNWQALKGERLGESDIWWLEQQLPRDARLNYKVVAGYGNEIRDPLNPITQLEGEGPVSQVRMPDYVYPAETLRREGVPRGAVSEPIIIESAQKKYPVAYRVYTPPGVKPDEPLPTIYVTDGQDFLHDEMGGLVIVLDNLLAEGVIRPVRAVFVDTRSTTLGFNRRDEMLGTSDSTVAFLADELIPAVEAAYPTASAPENRAILGISWGGVLAAYAGLERPDKFGLIATLSPYLAPREQVLRRYETEDRLPLKVYLSTGTFDLDVPDARRLRDALEAREYPLRYMEVNEGHGWGNWRALMDDMLRYFFPPES